MSSALMNNYAPLNTAFVRGKGVWLFDEQGERYLDALSGIAVCGLGHANKTLAKAISEQAEQLLHTSNLYQIPLQEQLASELTALAAMDKVFFCNSGAEANEAAIKLSRLYAHAQGFEQAKVIVMEGSFHGRTMATLTATGNPKVKDGFAPLVEGFIHVPYNDIEAVKRVLTEEKEVAAIMLEPLQGEGGVVVPAEGYLKSIRTLCDEHNCLMMLDEVQSGMCRTGEWFAYQHEDLMPDVITLAKALGNGVPIGACLARGRAAELFQPGSHGSTFGGNPLAARAAIAVIEILKEINGSQRAKDIGQWMLTELIKRLKDIEGVKDIRGKGLMIGIELREPCTELVEKALEKHCLINVTAGNVIRLLPPLIIEQDEAEKIVEIVSDITIEFLQGKQP